MLKWLIVMVVSLVILTAISPLLSRYGLGRLPGDITVQIRGRPHYLPITTTILMSIVLTGISRLF